MQKRYLQVRIKEPGGRKQRECKAENGQSECHAARYLQCKDNCVYGEEGGKENKGSETEQRMIAMQNKYLRRLMQCAQGG